MYMTSFDTYRLGSCMASVPVRTAQVEQLEFRFDSIIQMHRETRRDRKDQDGVWYKYISEENDPSVIHSFIVITFSFELKLELIGIPIVAIGLRVHG